jgi:golgi SNAP receptor complex member 2
VDYRKIEQLDEELESLNESVSKHLVRQQKRMQEAKERTELLERGVMLPFLHKNVG